MLCQRTHYQHWKSDRDNCDNIHFLIIHDIVSEKLCFKESSSNKRIKPQKKKNPEKEISCYGSKK